MEVFTKTLYTIIDGEIIYNGMKDEETSEFVPGGSRKDAQKTAAGENE